MIVEEIESKRRAQTANSPIDTAVDDGILEDMQNGMTTGNAETGTSTAIDSKTSLKDEANGASVKHCDQSTDHFDSGIDTSDSCDEKKIKHLPVKAVKRQHSKAATANASPTPV